ncbi:MAG: sensor histidine kinase [Opitutae bacterium]|nr:sensor histidine kinase [Opitutae bacterium]
MESRAAAAALAGIAAASTLRAGILRAALACISLAALAPLAAHAQSGAPGPLRTAAEVLALSPDMARRELPVAVRGVVTAVEPDWNGKFTLQDASGGVYISRVGAPPAIGAVMEVIGVTRPGAFAPVIRADKVARLGLAALPPARQVSIERLMAGVEDCQRVEIGGVVRSVGITTTRKLEVDVSLGGYRVRVFPKLPPQVDPQSLIAAKVRVRGTVTMSFNAAIRQLTAVNLFVPTAEDFIVEQPETHPPFAQAAVAIRDIARYRADATLGERIHVRGAVTLQRLGLDLFVQDGTGGLQIQTTQAMQAPLGRTIEAVGFVEFVDYQPVLKDAVLRSVDANDPSPTPREVPFEELRSGLHPAEFILLRGRLLARSVRPVQREAGPFSGTRVLCTIQNADATFTAECETPQESSALTLAPLGALVAVAGVAKYDTGDDGKMRTLNLLLPTPASLRVLENPSWFTAERMIVGFLILSVILAGALAWLLTIAKKNAMLSAAVAEREQAQHELQRAHDLLEQRVKERTEQLQVEMGARKAAEVEFRAVLSERTRLARELHDGLEQTLTGIALQLDAATRLFAAKPAEAKPPLELARDFVRQSQLELRQSIWALRSRELDQFDLAEALAITCRQVAAGGAVAVECETLGARRRLPEIVEENLLRITQEALTNVLKHSGATLAVVRLSFAPHQVTLVIKDNGSGLAPERVAADRERHFGLLGMSERAKRLGGRLDLSGPPGEGTTVQATIPLDDTARTGAHADAPVI